ncbi:hypothetical protein AQF98_05370 [Pedobacter sp. Hv1]|nr:hypothetical protein AQF98_05370 [Pedobacter sp. Hv1]
MGHEPWVCECKNSDAIFLKNKENNNFEPLKKLFILFILSFHLVSATALHELVKLPVLFQHYFEHKALNNQLTFATYLVDHYNDVPHTDNDEERDNQLPFKSSNQQAPNGLGSLAIPQYHQVNLKFPIPTAVKLAVGYEEEHIPNSYQSKIWQPPKV